MSAWRSATLLALAGWITACTYLVDPEKNEVRCKPSEENPNPCASPLVCIDELCVSPPPCDASDGTNACPTGLFCQNNLCVDQASCKPGADVCGDGIDNDCDGKVDEEPKPNGKDFCGDLQDDDCDGKIDEGHDADDDNATWCGDSSKLNGGGIQDCDDRDPSRYPGAVEVCDGVDNDCDQETDETSDNKSLCGAGQECAGRCIVPSCAVDGSIKCAADQMCDVKTGKCVTRVCDEASCPPGQFCDSATGACSADKRTNGQPCASNNECASGSCFERAALRLSVQAERVCGQTCCSDSDCPSDQRCFASGSGARSCLPAALVPSQGTRMCTSSSQCGSGEACGISSEISFMGPLIETRRNVTSAVCRVRASGEVSVGDGCGFDSSSCESQQCVTVSVGFFGSTLVCTNTCGTSADCAALRESIGTTSRAYCRFLGSTAGGFGGTTDYAPVCVVARSSSETGSGGPGASCTSGSACLDGACVGATSGQPGFCAPTCCNDSQCGLVGDRPTYCRPVAFGTRYETRCVP